MNDKLHMATFILLIIGGLNWLLYAIGWDLGQFLGNVPYLMETIYILVGLSAIYEAATHKGRCKACNPTIARM